jgi:pleckstrin homology domain-containing family G member 4
MDEDCFENSSKPSLDLQAPLQTNAHLYCHASTLQLDMEDCNFLDQKTKKYVDKLSILMECTFATRTF